MLARERHQPIVTAAPTPSAHEAAGQHPAAKEGVELLDDVPRQRAAALLRLLGEGREVIAHESMHDPVADGVAGADVGVCTAVGHRWARGWSDPRAVAGPLRLPMIPGPAGVAAGGGRHGGDR